MPAQLFCLAAARKSAKVGAKSKNGRPRMLSSEQGHKVDHPSNPARYVASISDSGSLGTQDFASQDCCQQARSGRRGNHMQKETPARFARRACEFPQTFRGEREISAQALAEQVHNFSSSRFMSID